MFVEDKYCQSVFKWFDYIRNNYEDKIHGYVIMPNHIHCLIYISDKSKPLPILIFNAKRFLAYEVVNLLKNDSKNNLLNYFKENKTKPKSKHKIFKDRYDSQIIQSRKYFLEKLNYIHNNVCAEKWRLAEKPQDYPYSSARNYMSGKGIYDIDVMDF
ncbi:MAG: transposase [Candidatus Falkowbacteria bacterium]|nr:transposase [Candidatus Falkowbacteria bacterium]